MENAGDRNAGSLQVVPECAIFEDGGKSRELKFKDCKKNPGHKKFAPVKEFMKDPNIPEHWRTGWDGKKLKDEEIMARITDMINRTVLVQVQYTSTDRPDTYDGSTAPYPYCKYRGSNRARRTGTGFIYFGQSEPCAGKCPCPNCIKSENPYMEYWKFFVFTATHVVFDTSEAKETIVECFYDSEEDKVNGEVVTLYGVNMDSVQSQVGMRQSDHCDGLLCVTHDEESVTKIKSRIEPHCVFMPIDYPLCIVSHPHGLSKMISTEGKLVYVNIPIEYKDEINHWLPQYTKWSLPHTPGESNTLDTRTEFTLPDSADHVMRYDCDKRVVTFPPGTKFESEDGEEIVIEDNAEFEGEELSSQFRYNLSPGRCWYYDIPTCEGTSGALVPCYERYGQRVLNHYTHFGRDAKTQCNRSCNIDYDKEKILLQKRIKIGLVDS